ncbi:MAG: STAS domain-containing protein [Planctomycetes bacterium]|nr:STAS domain-containing protein [Planctomycetota bacterium]
MSDTQLHDLISRHEVDLQAEWAKAITSAGSAREDLMKPEELRLQCSDLLRRLRQALKHGGTHDLTGPEWKEVREMLVGVSRTRASQGFTPSETANFVFSLKEPLFQRLRSELSAKPAQLAEETWSASTLIDKMGLLTMETFQQAREDVIRRQQEAMLELSTPVVKLWDGILALPLIGTLDSARTQVVMESLLQRVVAEGTVVVILDITGVPTVDTLVAQHLLKTVTAARLMGTDCIISGIRPQIAQTIVHLGVDLTSVITKASLADAFKIALARRNLMVVKRTAAVAAPVPAGV